MTRAEALQAAIAKAFRNGFHWHDILPGMPDDAKFTVYEEEILFADGNHIDTYRLLFDHDFAKAVWGQTFVHIQVLYLSYRKEQHKWQEDKDIAAFEFHLQEQALADDPLDYLLEQYEEGTI